MSVKTMAPEELAPDTRVPATQEFEEELRQILHVLPPEQVWVHPDCGLKTRRWEEVAPALKHMIAATRQVRSALSLQADVL